MNAVINNPAGSIGGGSVTSGNGGYHPNSL